MTLAGSTACHEDPCVINWKDAALPEAWPDRLKFYNPLHFYRILRAIFGPRQRIILPEGLNLQTELPQYILREFHHIPNGNYSMKLVDGYSKGFDIAMLGSMRTTRRQIAEHLAQCESVLDVGCGGGRLAGALRQMGVKDVWGVDPSPYLLQNAAQNFPGVKFVQGIAEKTGFPDARFDGIGACYLFHELPGKISDRCLEEFCRILKPGGKLIIAEPSPLQMVEQNFLQLWKAGGFLAFYYAALARLVFEPYVREWHSKDIASWLSANGFRLISDDVKIPTRLIVAEKA